jgi:hypothetical protein
MLTEFFHKEPRKEAYRRISEVMASGTVCLQGAVCYVTKEGCLLLDDHIERFKLPRSFFIAGYNEVSDISAINGLCAKAPGKFYFHGVAHRGSEKCEGHFLPGLMHAKIIYAEGESDATVWAGSHNLTNNALRGVNIEAATITKGDKRDPFFQHVREFLESIRRESFAGPAALPETSGPDSPGSDSPGSDSPGSEPSTFGKPVRELVLVHCEASEDQIKSIKERKACYISVHLRQDAYDSLCRPPANPDKHVRLLFYPPGTLTDRGPKAPPSLVKAGELYGVNFTEKSVRNGNTADWPKMSYSIEEPAGNLFQPLKICAGPHDPSDDVTVFAIRVDDILKEPDESEKCCILKSHPRRELAKKTLRVDLSPLEGQRRKRYVEIIQGLKPVYVVSGDTPLASVPIIKSIFEKWGEEVRFERNEKKPFRFIQNAKLFELPEDSRGPEQT